MIKMTDLEELKWTKDETKRERRLAAMGMHDDMMCMDTERGLSNATFVCWSPYHTIPELLARCDPVELADIHAWRNHIRYCIKIPKGYIWAFPESIPWDDLGWRQLRALSDETIVRFADVLPLAAIMSARMSGVEHIPTPMELLRKVAEHIRYDTLTEYDLRARYPLQFILEFACPEMDWEAVSARPDLPLDFIREHAEHIKWTMVAIHNTNLTEEFLVEFQHLIDLRVVRDHNRSVTMTSRLHDIASRTVDYSGGGPRTVHATRTWREDKTREWVMYRGHTVIKPQGAI